MFQATPIFYSTLENNTMCIINLEIEFNLSVQLGQLTTSRLSASKQEFDPASFGSIY